MNKRMLLSTAALYAPEGPTGGTGDIGTVLDKINTYRGAFGHRPLSLNEAAYFCDQIEKSKGFKASEINAESFDGIAFMAAMTVTDDPHPETNNYLGDAVKRQLLAAPYSQENDDKLDDLLFGDDVD